VSPAEDLLAIALSKPPILGGGRLVCVDGPAGSGKTTLATALAARASAASLTTTVVHMDDLYEGWDGLPGLTTQLDSILLPLAAGRPGSYRFYDWETGAFTRTVTVAPSSLLVLEGVGSGAAAYDDLRSALAWVDAPYDVRRARGIARDGESFAPHWDAWAAAEAEHYARECTRERADVIVDTG